MDQKSEVTFALTRGEAARLHEEIGDLPKSRAGPKLLELYRRLDALLALDWSKQNGHVAPRPKRVEKLKEAMRNIAADRVNDGPPSLEKGRYDELEDTRG